MGANIMRLDDTYSFQVISRTVQTVIPALIRVRLKQIGFVDQWGVELGPAGAKVY